MGKRWREDGEGGVGKRSVNPEDVVTRNGKRLAACPSDAQDWRRAPVTRKTPLTAPAAAKCKKRRKGIRPNCKIKGRKKRSRRRRRGLVDNANS